jgi:hypothetical protein
MSILPELNEFLQASLKSTVLKFSNILVRVYVKIAFFFLFLVAIYF